jgi:type 1 fimbriae regulatory protein FimB
MKTKTTPKLNATGSRLAMPTREMSRVSKDKPKLVVVAVDAHERDRDFLAKWEVEALIKAARGGRHGVRDALIVSLMFRHGLRATELCRLRVSNFNLLQARLWVPRLKNGLSTEQPLDGDDLRLARRYLRERQSDLPWMFVSERGAALTRKGVYYLITTAALRAGEDLAIHVHPHMLRHSTGHELANQGRDLRLIQDYLGQRDPKNSVRYTQTAAARFEGIFGR